MPVNKANIIGTQAKDARQASHSAEGNHHHLILHGMEQVFDRVSGLVDRISGGKRRSQQQDNVDGYSDGAGNAGFRMDKRAYIIVALLGAGIIYANWYAVKA